jgi:hypothetical protein
MYENIAILLCVALAVGTLSFWLFNFLQHKTKHVNLILLVFSSVVIVWIVFAAYFSTQFPGLHFVNHKENEYSLIGQLTRDYFILPSAFLSFLLPIWWVIFISGILSIKNISSSKLPIIVTIFAVILTLVGVCFAIFTGCNHAGVCF